MTITNYLASKREQQKERRRQKLTYMAEDLLQVTELDSQLWLTYGGAPVIPSDMLKEDIISTIEKLRELYIKRKI